MLSGARSRRRSRTVSASGLASCSRRCFARPTRRAARATTRQSCARCCSSRKSSSACANKSRTSSERVSRHPQRAERWWQDDHCQDLARAPVGHRVLGFVHHTAPSRRRGGRARLLLHDAAGVHRAAGTGSIRRVGDGAWEPLRHPPQRGGARPGVGAPRRDGHRRPGRLAIHARLSRIGDYLHSSPLGGRSARATSVTQDRNAVAARRAAPVGAPGAVARRHRLSRHSASPYLRVTPEGRARHARLIHHPVSNSAVRPYAGRRVLLGISGGIASYKSAWLARLLTKAGADVDVVMTRSALEFVGAVTFEALTGREVHTGLFDAGRALDHVKLARAADAIVIAPATADLMARAATGQANDLLTACLLAAEAPVLMVPAMNDRMWSHAQTQHNVTHLRSLGYTVLQPDAGMLAAGEGAGPGRMPEPETIFAYVGRLLETDRRLAGRRVLVTAGPTRESIDPVRFLSNRSTGKMGVALAASAWRRGADVTLVAGPLAVAVPVGVDQEHVETTQEMRDAVERHIAAADVLVMRAAPSDYRAAEPP